MYQIVTLMKHLSYVSDCWFKEKPRMYQTVGLKKNLVCIRLSV